MNTREALINQSPSLALQRAAADLISQLDDVISKQEQLITLLNQQIALHKQIDSAHAEFVSDLKESVLLKIQHQTS